MGVDEEVSSVTSGADEGDTPTSGIGLSWRRAGASLMSCLTPQCLLASGVEEELTESVRFLEGPPSCSITRSSPGGEGARGLWCVAVRAVG